MHDHLRSELEQLFDLISQVEAGTLEAGAARSLINTMRCGRTTGRSVPTASRTAGW
ncbi:hypothetical protein [Nocardioides endophyticus]|uniref:hypothetical protein n=1 Tax=Nocardioides endophyticus TaxID=1353775 RepID=UPI0031EA5AB5